MPDLNTDHGDAAKDHTFPIRQADNGAEAGTVEAPRGVVLRGEKPDGIAGNKKKLH